MTKLMLSPEEKAKRDAKWDKMRAIQKEIPKLFEDGECSLLWLMSDSLLRTVLETQTSGIFDCMNLNQLFSLYRDAYRSENPDACETCFFGCTGDCEVNPGEQKPIKAFQGACRFYRRDDNFEN